MTLRSAIDAIRHATTPARGTLKPILSDDTVIESEGAAAAVFYTDAAQRIERHKELIIAVAAGGWLLVGWIIAMSGGPIAIKNLAVMFAFAIAGVPALGSVWGKLRKFKLDVDVLMLLGAVLAAWIGSPFEGALLLFLFALSGGLEAYALRRTQSAIIDLKNLAPQEALVLDDDGTHRVPLRRVRIDMRVLVLPGQKVPLDGVVVEESSSIDESAITGESVPRDRSVGDTVFAGTQNTSGRLIVKVTKTAADTTLARIVKLVTDARHHPATAQRLIDRIGPAYSAIVVLVAIAVGLIASAFPQIDAAAAVRRGIAVLIVASPCALIIATPVAYLSAIAAAARRGVLIKGGGHLESIARAAAFVFDKTGTLTTGSLQLTDVSPPAGIDETETLRLAGAIEGASNHPLADAVNDALTQRGITPYAVEDYLSIPGEGATGKCDSRSVWIGRPEHLRRYATGPVSADITAEVERLRHEGKTVSVILVEDEVGLLAFRDTVREGARECIEQLRRQGIGRIEMFTGDHTVVASRVAAELELDDFVAEMAPEQKLAAAKKLRASHGAVVLVGDGINDAPALAQADTGIAIGSMGADIALEAADVVLMKDRIEVVAWLHQHALRTARIVKENLTLALAVIGVLSVFAALGAIPLPLAVIGHEGSTVLVAINALRLLRDPSR